MSCNYTIRTIDGELYFGGWNKFGEIFMRPAQEKRLSNRMTATVATRNLTKIEKAVHKKCEVIPVSF